MRWQRWIAVPVTFLVIAGCQTYHQIAVSPGSQPARALGTVRVTRTDGAVLVLHDAVVLGDSIAGIPEGSSARLAMALTGVSRIDSKEFNTGRSVGLAFVVALVALTVLVVILIGTVVQGAK